jgi:hypothetical protein
MIQLANERGIAVPTGTAREVVTQDTGSGMLRGG